MSPVAAFRDGADFSAHQYSSRPQNGRQAHGKRPNPPAERMHRAIRAGFERRRTGAGRGAGTAGRDARVAAGRHGANLAQLGPNPGAGPGSDSATGQMSLRPQVSGSDRFAPGR